MAMSKKLETMRVTDKRLPGHAFVIINRRDFNPKINAEYDPRAPKKTLPNVVIPDVATPVPQSFVDNAQAISEWGKTQKTSRTPVRKTRKTTKKTK